MKIRNPQKVWIFLMFLALGVAFFTGNPVQAQSDSPLVFVLEMEGPLTPVMVGYLERGLERAQRENAAAVILQLDTPGGQVDLMNTMVEDIRGSEIPVIVYIAPRGAWAASAGTLITLAGHQAVMAPETTIGAASPVGSQGEDIEETMETKVKEVLRATARGLAEHRGEDAVKLAEETIENARAVSAKEALDAGLVDAIVEDIPALLEELNGRTVAVIGGEVTLDLHNARVVTIPETLIEQTLQLLVNPNIVFLLLSIGVQAVLIELSSPGGWVAGFVGAVCVLLAVYGMGILPVNWFGILFIILAFVLFILEVKTHALGGLTVAGAISFIAGSLILFNSVQLPGFPRISVPLVIGTGVVIALSFSVIVGFVVRAMRLPKKMGKETMVGKSGVVRTILQPMGTVYLDGELWSAELEPGEGTVREGGKVVVTAVDGLRLKVRRVH